MNKLYKYIPITLLITLMLCNIVASSYYYTSLFAYFGYDIVKLSSDIILFLTPIILIIFGFSIRKNNPKPKKTLEVECYPPLSNKEQKIVKNSIDNKVEVKLNQTKTNLN